MPGSSRHGPIDPASRQGARGWRRPAPPRRVSGGFFRPQPWLQSARDLPHPSVGVAAAVLVAAVGIWTAVALLLAGSQPTLPSSHAVQVSVQPSHGQTATGQGHLIWYRSGGLLVVVLEVKNLPPRTSVNALLVPSGSCSGTQSTGTRLIGTVRTNGQGLAVFNEELLGVSNLRFAAWSIWVEGKSHAGPPTACGVISLPSGSLSGS